MRVYALLIAILLLGLGQAPALAGPNAPICARVNGGAHMGAYDDCSYFSFEQCRMDRIGIGGFCVQNPYYAFAEPPPPRKRYRRR